MKLLPVHPALVALLLPRSSHGLASAEDALPQARPLPAESGEPDWHSAYERLRAQDEEACVEPPPPVVPPVTLWAPREAAAPAPTEVRGVAPTTPTTERIDALRQLAEPALAAAPLARVWQVELPGSAAAPAWQLQVEQAQPLAPLNLTLRVPPVAQPQARQQLSDLDRRLREAGHDVLRPRLRDASRAGRRSRPIDEVEP